MAKSGKNQPGSIAQNRRARHDYFIEDKFEAGLMLMGWEVKSIRDGKVQLAENCTRFTKEKPILQAATSHLLRPIDPRYC